MKFGAEYFCCIFQMSDSSLHMHMQLCQSVLFGQAIKESYHNFVEQ